MSTVANKQKVVIVGAGPVGALAALYAARRGDDVHIYELRGGKLSEILSPLFLRRWKDVARFYFRKFEKRIPEPPSGQVIMLHVFGVHMPELP